MTKKIAIIGGGISGLTAAYLLNPHYDIWLFEKDNRLGGNAYTYNTSDGETIDMAVAAYQRLVSGNFLKLLSELKIKTVIQPASVFLTVHDLKTKQGLYSTPFNLKGLIAQKFAFFREPAASDSQMTIKAVREAINMLSEGELRGLSVAETIALLPDLTDFRISIMLSPLCLLSSMYYDEIMKAPAEFFFGKLESFHSFGPKEMVFGLKFPKKFTRSYVEALSSHFTDKVVLNARINSVARNKNDVILKMEDGSQAQFNKVVFACNADQALALLENPTEKEQRLLGAWKYKEGLMVVHKDKTHFPKRELCQSWTCLRSTENGVHHFSISCCCWRLCPGTSNKSEYFSTQHPNFPIKEDLIDFKRVFRTPIFDFDSVPTIKDLPSLNGQLNSYYCGSHIGYGLHNDAVSSAMEVAKALGVQWPHYESPPYWRRLEIQQLPQELLLNQVA